MTTASSDTGTWQTPVFLRRRLAAESRDSELLGALACDESYWVRRQAARNPALTQDVIELMMRAGSTPDLRGFATPDPTLGPERIAQLVPLGGFAESLAARHPRTAADVLEALAARESAEVRLAVARHPNASVSALRRLSSDLEVAVRVAAAAHPSRDQAALELLRGAGASADLRFAGWPSVEPRPRELSAIWDTGAWGRYLAARRPHCEQRLLERAGADSDWRVRAALLQNPAAPDHLLEPYVVQCEVELQDVRVMGLRHPPESKLEPLLHHPDPEVRVALAQHPGTPARILRLLASDAERAVRAGVASHPHTPRREIERLVRAGSSTDLSETTEADTAPTARELALLARRGPWARMLVARHPATPAPLLARLLCDASPSIRQWALVHPSAPRQVVRDLIRSGSGDDLQGFHAADPEMSPEALRRLAALGPWARRLVALHPATSARQVARLARAAEWQVRRNVAMRDDLSAELRQALAQDRVAAVRAQARRQGAGNVGP